MKKNQSNKIDEDIIKIREVSSTPIDLHIISKYPSKYDDFLKRNKIEYVTYQYENIEEEFVINPIKQTQYGLAITSHTSIDSFEDATDISTETDRIVKANFSISVRGYLIQKDFNYETLQKKDISVKKVVVREGSRTLDIDDVF